MKKHIYDKWGETCLRTEEAEPECGKDFCDSCGDCLHCYGSDECFDQPSGEHIWVEYEGDAA